MLQLPSSTAYYKTSEKPRGTKPSEFTLKNDGSLLSNDEVVKTLIDEVISEEFNRYGYRMCNEELKALGFYINYKKTYRLMNQKALLLEKVGINKIRREWVTFRKIVANYCMSICVWISNIFICFEDILFSTTPNTEGTLWDVNVQRNIGIQFFLPATIGLPKAKD